MVDQFLDKYIYPFTKGYFGRGKTNENGLPIYSKNEEIANSTTHGFGILIGIGMIIASRVYAKSTLGFVGGIIFGCCIVFLYAASALYHATSPDHVRAKKILRVFDHCSIFVLVAGTCTPFAFNLISQSIDGTEWIFYATIWLVSLGGITLLCINFNRFNSIEVIMYVALGVLLISRCASLIRTIGGIGIALLIGGGVTYLIGLLFYGLGLQRKWMHTVFHVFCLVGSVIHCVCVCLYVV